MAEQATDERLLEQAADGNTEAFKILYERYRGPIFRFAYRLLGSVEAAEDVAHDCFLSLIKEPGRFDATRASLRTYLYAAARNQATKRYQSLGRETGIEELPHELSGSDRPGPMALVLNEELGAEIERAMASLPAAQREALVLFEYEDLSLAEIAAIVGADSNTVKVRVFRAREKLRARLDRYFRIGDETVTVKRA
ncbi:MAG: polymerase sigma-70 factor, subfamily [Blastocatellia bacterium]|nr:polymerase sigma-70 factor, subfamily [Blastocatellia bacterium]